MNDRNNDINTYELLVRLEQDLKHYRRQTAKYNTGFLAAIDVALTAIKALMLYF